MGAGEGVERVGEKQTNGVSWRRWEYHFLLCFSSFRRQNNCVGMM